MGRWTDGQWSIQAILIEWEDPCCCSTYDQSKQLINPNTDPYYRRTREEERRDEVTCLLADEVNWPDPELRRREAEALESPAQKLHSKPWSRYSGRLEVRAARDAATAGGWRTSRSRHWLKDGKEP